MSLGRGRGPRRDDEWCLVIPSSWEPAPMSSSTTSALSRQPLARQVLKEHHRPPGSAGRAPQPVHGPVPGRDGIARRLPEPDGHLGAHHRPDRHRPGGPGFGSGAGPAVGVDHPAGAAGPGPHRPQHPSEVVVVHSYRHRREKNSHRDGRQDRARGPPGADLGAAPPVGPGPRHGRRADPGPGSGEVQPEVPAIRELLEPLDPGGVVVTADAMHTQVNTAGWIRDQGGHYVLTVKGNQKTSAQDAQGPATEEGPVRLERRHRPRAAGAAHRPRPSRHPSGWTSPQRLRFSRSDVPGPSRAGSTLRWHT